MRRLGVRTSPAPFEDAGQDWVTACRGCEGSRPLPFPPGPSGSRSAVEFCRAVHRILQQCKRDLLFESVGAQVSRVEGQVGEITIACPMTGFLRKIEDIPSQAIAHSQELFSKGLHLSRIHWNLMPNSAPLPRAMPAI